MRRTILLSLVLAIIALNIRMFVSPRRDHPTSADGVNAVVALSGDPARLQRALELMDAGVAPTLVVSFGTSTADERCGQRAPYEVICVTPKPATTAGEATTIGKIITEQGWTKVALVTSTFHLTRSRVLFNRCTATEIIPVAAPFKLTPDNGWDRIQHEWGGLIAALLFRRSC